jgi:hypothetical protein
MHKKDGMDKFILGLLLEMIYITILVIELNRNLTMNPKTKAQRQLERSDNL